MLISLNSYVSLAIKKVSKINEIPVNCISHGKVEQKTFTTEALRHGVLPLFFLSDSVSPWFKKCTTYS